MYTLAGHRSNEFAVLPSPEVDNLLHYAKVSDTKQRDIIELHVMVIRSMKHVGKLLTIFEKCAEQNDLSNMRTIRGIFYTMLLWANTDMIQELVLDKHMYGVLGVFDFMSKRNQSFREQFEQMPRMDLLDHLKKSATLVQAFRQSENLVFFKTHIAPQHRQTASLIIALDRMCTWKHLTIVNWVQQDTLLLPQLFHLLKKTSNSTDNDNDVDIDLMTQRRSGLQFLFKVFEYAWNDMQRFASASFFRAMTNKGLLDVIEQLLSTDDQEILTTTTRLLHTISQMDLRVLQHHILDQNEKHHPHQQSGLLKIILEQMVHVDDYALKQQLFDVVKLVLGLTDTSMASTKIPPVSSSTPSSSYGHQFTFSDDPITGNILKLFYDRYASTLISPIYDIQTALQQPQPSSSPSTMMLDTLAPAEMNPQQVLFYSSLCEFLQSNLLQYGTRTKRILQDPSHLCFQDMAHLLRCSDPSLRLDTIGFFRAAVGLRDNEINTLLIQQNVFGYLIRLLTDLYPQQQQQQEQTQQQQEQQQQQQPTDNDKIYMDLVELLDFIQQRNIFPLITHIVDEFGGLLEPMPIYQSLKNKYDQRSSTSSSYIFMR